MTAAEIRYSANNFYILSTVLAYSLWIDLSIQLICLCQGAIALLTVQDGFNSEQQQALGLLSAAAKQ